MKKLISIFLLCTSLLFPCVSCKNNIDDNHIYSGNALGFEKVVWTRCLDLNDRSLRKIERKQEMIKKYSEEKRQEVIDARKDGAIIAQNTA